MQVPPLPTLVDRIMAVYSQFGKGTPSVYHSTGELPSVDSGDAWRVFTSSAYLVLIALILETVTMQVLPTFLEFITTCACTVKFSGPLDILLAFHYTWDCLCTYR